MYGTDVLRSFCIIRQYRTDVLRSFCTIGQWWALPAYPPTPVEAITPRTLTSGTVDFRFRVWSQVKAGMLIEINVLF